MKNVKQPTCQDMNGSYTDQNVLQFLQQSTVKDPPFRSLPHDDEASHMEIYSALAVKILHQLQVLKCKNKWLLLFLNCHSQSEYTINNCENIYKCLLISKVHDYGAS